MQIKKIVTKNIDYETLDDYISKVNYSLKILGKDNNLIIIKNIGVVDTNDGVIKIPYNYLSCLDIDNLYNFEKPLNKEKLQYEYKNINRGFSRRATEKWDAMSEFKFGLAIVYMDGKYAVIDYNSNIVFDFTDNLNYIGIESHNILLLKNKNNETAIYKLNYGYMKDFDSENIDLIKPITDNILKVYDDRKTHFKIFINNKFVSAQEYFWKDFDFFVDERDDTIILENKKDKITEFRDMDYNLLLKLDTNKYLKFLNCIYYMNDQKLYKYNIEEKKSLKIEPRIKDIDKNLIEFNEEKFSNYKYGYIDKESNEIIVSQNKLYGLMIKSDSGTSTIRWVDNLDKLNQLELLVLNNLIEKTDTYNDQIKKNIKK